MVRLITPFQGFDIYTALKYHRALPYAIADRPYRAIIEQLFQKP